MAGSVIDDSQCCSSSRFEESGEFSLLEFWVALWAGRWIIFSFSFCFALISIFVALNKSNVYRAEAILVPVEDMSTGGLSKVASQLGGLAGLAGISLAGGRDKTHYAIEVLKSRDFISSFIRQHDLLVPLMASTGWDSKAKVLEISPEIYDEDTGQWTREATSIRPSEPTDQEAHKAFINLISISRDKTTGFVRLGIEFYSPVMSKEWVDLLVLNLNEEIRSRDVSEAEQSIAFLRGKVEEVAVTDMRSIFFSLIEEQTRTIMISEVRKEYVFKTLDPAVVPELKSGPSRPLICLLGLLLGGGVGVIAALMFFVVRQKFKLIS